MASSSRDSRDDFHPLEIIPYFRRFPRTITRDIVYTFIWSSLFGITFYLIGSLSSGGRQSLTAFSAYMVISNAIGYSIHALFHAGRALGLPQAARASGHAMKTVYFSVVPLLGVFIGFTLASLVFDFGFTSWFTKPAAILSIVVTSLVISTIMSVIFFWRERSAVAEADVARERERH